ncbi:MAG TPA: prolyl oligopeptidase family serine peptidase, partial [Flavisolibacter sp.]|nr:prolyl oligopeptidase family serine peptidase [Flavisolibacter sp.]
SGGGKTYNYGLRWNRKGDRLFYISRAANQSYSEVYRVDPKDPGSGIPLLRFEGPNWDLQDIAGDENTLLLSAPHNGSNALNSLWLYDVGARTKKIILPTEGKTGAYYNATFSRDARGIYLLTNQNSEHSQLAYYDLAKKKLQVLTAFDWDVRTASLSPDGSLLAFTVNEAGNTKAYIYQTATKACTAVQGLPAGFMAGLAWAKDSRSLGFQFSTANASSDVYVWDVRAGKAEPWVKNELGFDASVLYPPRPVKWRSFDGREISGFLYPASKKFKGKRPVIISIHGGPVMQALPLYDPIANFYTNELGVAVIYPNIRGSAGFGKAFTELDNGLKKEDAVADIGALLTWIAGQPGLDAKRVMVTGGSYGGYMTYRAAAKYGDQIRCAVAGFSSPDLLSANGVDSAYRAFFSAEYGDTSQPEVRDYLRKVSPRNNADKIKAPILIVNGKNDPRVPVDAVQEMVAALRKNGCTVWHLVANDEGHGFVKQKNEAFLLYTTALFIERYLLNDQ